MSSARSGNSLRILAICGTIDDTLVRGPWVFHFNYGYAYAANPRTYKDQEFQKEYKKFTADDPTPLLPEAHERIIREIPRDPEVGQLFKKLMGADPLPPR